MVKVVGERSRSDSEFSELAGDVVDDHEECSADVMKRGRGGAREAESAAENSCNWVTSISSLEMER